MCVWGGVSSFFFLLVLEDLQIGSLSIVGSKLLGVHFLLRSQGCVNLIPACSVCREVRAPLFKKQEPKNYEFETLSS